MDATKIGTFIAAERRAKGWTQRQLADKLQLTDKAVSRWETGKGLPDVSFLLPLAAALDISVGERWQGRASPSRLRYRPPRHAQRNSLLATRRSLARSCAAAVPAQCWPGCCCLPQRFYLCNFCGC